MPLQRPTHDQLDTISRDLGMHMSADDIASFAGLIEPSLKMYDIIHDLPDELPAVKYPRTPGHQPMANENPYNAWYVKTTIAGAPGGKLAGKTLALKDNICLAGVPMMNGSYVLEGYMPDVDATIVNRILDAGGTILGKVHCENYCFSGGSHTSARGAVHNPRKMGYSAGGSSSGSAAVVASGEVDMAIGGDQGGSIRMPAAFCGVYGMKPSWGLVPYTGIAGIDATIDHTGPMTGNVADNALLLEVLAGPDGLDPRQQDRPPVSYTAALGQSVKGLKIALVPEGFGLPGSEAVVDDKVRAAAALYAKLGATVDEVSIPMHSVSAAIWSPIGFEGALATMFQGNGFGTGSGGLYVTSLVDAASAWRTRADDLPDTVKISLLLGEYAHRFYRGRYYAKAQNLVRRLRAAYDAVLADYDLLLMPTVPMRATPLPPPGSTRELNVQRSFEMLANTPAFDISHHPAMNVPCGMEDGLPIGMMLVGRHFDETTIYRAAHAFEQAGDWQAM